MRRKVARIRHRGSRRFDLNEFLILAGGAFVLLVFIAWQAGLFSLVTNSLVLGASAVR